MSGNIFKVLNFYSKRDPHNLSEFSNGKSPNDNFKQVYLFNHFKTVRRKGFLNDVIIFIDKNHGCEPNTTVETLTKTPVLVKLLIHATTTYTSTNKTLQTTKKKKKLGLLFLPSLVFNRKFTTSELKSKYIFCHPDKQTQPARRKHVNAYH